MSNYLPVLLVFVISILVAGAILILSRFVGKGRPNPDKLAPYECGVNPIGTARERFSVKFYLVAMLFLLFDIEAVFLFPWAVVYRNLGLFGFFEMLLFILAILAGYIYVWKKGALEWER